MTAKNIVSALLLLFVASSVVYLVFDASYSRPDAVQDTQGEVIGRKTPEKAPVDGTAAKPGEQTGHKLTAYYFHRTQRCKTCLTIEAYAEEALRAAFSEAFEAGALEWRTVNIEEPANEHFVQEYELVTSTLVLVDTHDGKRKDWRALHEVWDLANKKPEFLTYVTNEAKAMLESRP